MALPTNQAKGQGCNPVSSNCVIWQGPDIPCINLCHGDSVTDVVFKLATELCDILKTLDINTYDLTCFQPICPNPENFHDLIQFLITKICELQCCCDGTKPVESPCPDACVVTVAPCFYFTNNVGDVISTMTLTEYVTAIGNKVCQIAGQISTDNARLNTTENTVAAQGQRLTTVEEEVAAMPSVLPATCLYPADTPIVTGVTTIATELCNLESATGSPIQILQSIQQQCANMDSLKTLANRSSVYAAIPGWVTSASYATLSDSINNMWLTICDMRAAVENILKTCCCTDCDDVIITMTATLEGDTVTLFFNGSIPTGLTDCYPSGNLITITDANGGTYTTYVEVVNNLNSSTTVNLSGTPVNTSLNLTIVIQGCWKRPAPGSDCGGLECSRLLQYTIVNTAPCPELTLNSVTTPGNTSISYEFNNTVATPISYAVELYTSPGGVFVGANVHANPAVGLVNGIFNGLLGGTNYYVIVRVTVGTTVTSCPQAFITTDPYACAAPINVSATNLIP